MCGTKDLRKEEKSGLLSHRPRPLPFSCDPLWFLFHSWYWGALNDDSACPLFLRFFIPHRTVALIRSAFAAPHPHLRVRLWISTTYSIVPANRRTSLKNTNARGQIATRNLHVDLTWFGTNEVILARNRLLVLGRDARDVSFRDRPWLCTIEYIPGRNRISVKWKVAEKPLQM